MTRQEAVTFSIEALRLKQGDIIIVHDEKDMDTLLEMTQQGIGFTPYQNPVLFIKGGIESASKGDLLDALAVLEQTDAASRIITKAN
jgi:hypothetical protein